MSIRFKFVSIIKTYPTRSNNGSKQIFRMLLSHKVLKKEY